MVATHQQDGRQVLGQHLQPGHVEGAGHGPLPGQRQAPVHRGKQTLRVSSDTSLFSLR